MIKCVVLEKTCITVEKGSTVLVSEVQFELARRVLKPIKDESTKTNDAEELAEEVEVEKPVEKKGSKSKKDNEN